MSVDFFISYTVADRPWAEWIAAALEEAGYSTVLQAWDFRPGQNFVEQMDRVMRESERTIAVLSLLPLGLCGSRVDARRHAGSDGSQGSAASCSCR